MIQIAILILAAGASSRMEGTDKLMKMAGNTPLLARITQRAMATGLPTYVTLPDVSHPRHDLVRECGARAIVVPDWATGMAASIRTGVAALPNTIDAVMILPGDMPDLQTSDLGKLAEIASKSPGKILRATSQTGIPGHPVIFPADLFGELLTVTGDQGARRVLRAHADRVHTQALPGNRAICDLDTPAHWAAWATAQVSVKQQ
jgi:CTP:molybdopterin cytidylyltransferase MocA